MLATFVRGIIVVMEGIDPLMLDFVLFAGQIVWFFYGFNQILNDFFVCFQIYGCWREQMELYQGFGIY